jgi:Macrophage killing protein with similarity to conjugation protein.
MDKLSPDVFVSVKIEGTPELKRVTTQDQPILNQDAIKTWLMEGINEVFNWNSTDYKKVLKDSAYFFDEGFYKVLLIHIWLE